MNAKLPEPGADERAHSDHLSALLREEIASHGPMPFSRFMERCLYTPGLGYYSAGKAKFGADGDFDFDFRQETDGIFRAAINLGMALLPAIAFDFRDGHALNAQRRKRFANFIQFERLNDGRDELHGLPLFGPWLRASIAA